MTSNREFRLVRSKWVASHVTAITVEMYFRFKHMDAELTGTIFKKLRNEIRKLRPNKCNIQSD